MTNYTTYKYKNTNNADKKAFELISNLILKNPEALIGLAVGKTTDGLHKLISKDAKKHPQKWRKIKIFQIDETYGISPNSPLSFNHEIRTELKDLIKILNKKNFFLIDGKKNYKQTIKEAYAFIKKHKGFDLITLGIGPEYDPHIAYNTCGKSSLKSKMRLVELHPKISEKINLRRDILHTPTYGITLGIADILKSKTVLLMAYGKDKKRSLKLAFDGKVNLKKASASALQKHNNLFVIISEIK